MVMACSPGRGAPRAKMLHACPVFVAGKNGQTTNRTHTFSNRFMTGLWRAYCSANSSVPFVVKPLNAVGAVARTDNATARRISV